MDITFIGSGDAFGSGGRLQTCILVEARDTRFCFDFGASSLIGLRRENINPNSINAIVLSHLHGDHCGGIPFLLLDAMLGAKRTTPLTIIGPQGTREHLHKLQQVLFPGSQSMVPDFDLDYVEIPAGSRTEAAGLSITSTEARHTRDTQPLALRVEVDGKQIAYTGDGELTDSLKDLVAGVDLLIAESYFYNKPVKWHLNYPDIAGLQAERVVLTHMHTSMLEQTESVPEECAYDGYTLKL